MKNVVSLYEVEPDYEHAERQEGNHYTAHLCTVCALHDIRYVVQWIADTGNDCCCDACGWNPEVDGAQEIEERFANYERRIYGQNGTGGEIIFA